MYQAVEITCCLRAEFVNRKLSRISSAACAAVDDLTSLVPRPVCAIRVTREGLEPSANFPDKLDRWRHIRNRLGRMGTRPWFNIPFKEYKTVLDSGFQEVNPNSLSVELGFRIPVVGGIPDSLSCIWIPKPRIPVSKNKNFLNSGSRFL